MLKYSSPDLKNLQKTFKTANKWHKVFVKKNMLQLGRRVSFVMQDKVSQHRYTGKLEDSIKAKYLPSQMRLEIGPTAKRGKWDAGLILERGTRPIPNLPFGPIKLWADFRGIPAGPVWMKIRREGVTAHPFLQRTLDDGRTTVATKNTAFRIGQDLVTFTLQSLKTGAITSGPTIFEAGA